MPVCRRPLEPRIAPPEHKPVRLSRYVLTRRIAPRAANDNRRPWSAHAVQWGIVLGVAPAPTALIFLSGLF